MRVIGALVLQFAGKEEWRYSQQPELNYTADHEREAYVTVLHSSEDYVCGAIVLAQSIIQSNSATDLVLLHDKSLTDKSLQGLQAAGWKTKRISRIRSPFSRKGSYNEWNYSKLRVWQLIEYDRVIFIDADLLILKKIDKFFYFPQLSAAGNDRSLFNSGIMVIEPSLCMFEKLMLKSFKVASYNGGDQGFLNEIFTWWHRLPSKINYLKVFKLDKHGNDEHQIPENLYTIHYLGLKPWLCYKDYDCNWDKVDHHIFASDSAHKKWWEVYDAMPKKLQKFCALTKHGNWRIKKWRGIARNASLVDGHWKIRVRDPRRYHLVE
ncbi:putative UDP-glucuronate:xylan alpha-glucuronosyltransferase 4 [Mangifera indica]|uniref:putative UDP-glucuronate:xylan alpha-glucuronosyltransferase 4 n=1 Tax=Mangifera indica TaxID=29780 RepID=UPI001CFBE690|nr:putative UDP-glucuronate:xylan alpha-glucuronosyltransferase 4 [Mangifera indica]